MITFTENCKETMKELGVEPWIARTTLTKADVIDRVEFVSDGGPAIEICLKRHAHRQMLVIAGKSGRFSKEISLALPVPRSMEGDDPFAVLNTLANKYGRPLRFGEDVNKLIREVMLPPDTPQPIRLDRHLMGTVLREHTLVGQAYVHAGNTAIEVALAFAIDITDLKSAMITGGDD